MARGMPPNAGSLAPDEFSLRTRNARDERAGHRDVDAIEPRGWPLGRDRKIGVIEIRRDILQVLLRDAGFLLRRARLLLGGAGLLLRGGSLRLGLRQLRLHRVQLLLHSANLLLQLRVVGEGRRG
ncbi:MAG: hypothetical protein WA858_26840 [Xanthobacteraceae bacterium]